MRRCKPRRLSLDKENLIGDFITDIKTRIYSFGLNFLSKCTKAIFNLSRSLLKIEELLSPSILYDEMHKERYFDLQLFNLALMSQSWSAQIL